MLCVLLLTADGISYDEHTAKLNISGAFNSVTAGTFPLSVKGWCVFVRLQAEPAEFNTKLKLKADLLDGKNKVIATWSKDSVVPDEPGKNSIFFDEVLNFEKGQITAPGSYEIALAANRKKIASYPLEVVEKGSILLIDDDLDQLSILAATLSHLPYAIDTALSGTRALEMLQTQAPVLVITDMVMPDVSGSEIVRAIRSSKRLKSTKIIITTSMLKYISDQDRRLADKIILKPAQKGEIADAVKELLGT